VAQLSVNSNVELMTHPVVREEYDYLRSDQFSELFKSIRLDSYAALQTREKLNHGLFSYAGS